jgi:transposase InsO family protein
VFLSLKEIHEPYGHTSIQPLKPFIKNISSDKVDKFERKNCLTIKITKQPFSGISTKAKKVFERIHLDLIGPITPESNQKHKFILTIVDNFSGYLGGIPLVNKDQTAEILISLLQTENKRLGYFPSTVFSDGGGEFINNRLVSFFQLNRIQALVSEPYHPEHNGRAERANRTICEAVRACVASSKIPKQYWPEILKTACLSLNQIPRNKEEISPWELVHGSKLPSNYIHPIGNPVAFLNMQQEKGDNLDQKGGKES